ncbi:MULTISPECIES: excinuclease ABC subunit UvrC [Chryseobacterium]|jgi:excinuclease ABC subunit C|uniref:UvrABC system protein C n=1 Tax=Chryseobacterium rhizosphaerae TaxID=395937 RepID=A0AAE4C4R2_9FLAO|nr:MULTISPECIES: excinuclease ABC subunit UvrC [Chryseobacterium]MDC8101767.1 excinuclease ABC subunit UvrC [Chryseobacterium rhizosphaerae]MDR6528377.1 excinuclease ABC subunit C [Chryseobacterium rhizosphaerae]MDR6544414.1 excinuclease ABC subunit C [Chryseobacterium rhizosphaerae]REC76005.1 excinuclease ABC subunit UvrC [Chryseobacterium rhizosphaerae]SMC87070.1 Excinuclease ABC subunit C [Chryseobacterium sp. YR221]
MNPSLELQLKTLPSEPGVYRYYDKNEQLLYVGKAKNLKKRVLSYFNKNLSGYRIKIMVGKIQRLETTIVNSEYDALLLENNLIKEHQPFYNVMLKDDKTYPWICIKNEDFPRIFLTRNVIKDGSEYYGPYAKVRPAKILLDTIKHIYKLRTCNLNLSPNKIADGKYKVCLEYHIKNCEGPCEDLESKEDYDEKIDAIRGMIKGEFRKAKEYLVNQMMKLASNLQFEEAQIIKERLDILEDYQAKNTVVNPNIDDVDVFGMVSDETAAYVNFFKIRNGNIIQSFTTEIKKILEETDEDIMEEALIEIRQKFSSNSKEVLLPFHLSVEIPNVKLIVPKVGDKKRIVELSEKNAKEYRLEKLKQVQIVDPERHTNRIMAEMQKLLRMPVEPRHIEGFDNSNIQGTNPVSACVVFKDGRPSKADYRIFHPKTVEGPNDFATMEEVIYRRYKRMVDEGESLPQLILIDGGKGQLSSAVKSLKLLGLYGKITIVGIAKRLEEIFFPEDPIPLYLDKKSETLKILQRVRDEAHRFGVKHHRTRRSNSTIKSELEEIPGVGEKTIELLLSKLKSVKRIKESNLETLEEILGKSKAKVIWEFFNSN